MATLSPIGNAATRVTNGIRKAISNKAFGILEYYRKKNAAAITAMRVELAFEDLPCVVYSDNRKTMSTWIKVSYMCEDIGITVEDAFDIMHNRNGIFGGFIMHLDNE